MKWILASACALLALTTWVFADPGNMTWVAQSQAVPTSTIDVSSLTAGTQTVNGLSPTCFTNPADTVAANTSWTSVSTKYLTAPTTAQFIIKGVSICNERDVSVKAWTAQGYVYVRLDSNGKAIYFFHDYTQTNGYLEIGIVTGLDESAYPGGTYYPLYTNNNLVGTVSGYSKTPSSNNNSYFTFGVQGFDIFAQFDGTEFVRFKEYRQMSSGAVALKTGGDGFRGDGTSTNPLTAAPLRLKALWSAYADGQLDLRDFDVRNLQTTGTITATQNTLTVADVRGFKIGDWVIVATGAESGAGARGTIGVGGQWPAKTYLTTAALQADNTQPANTFAWAQDTGLVWQFVSGAWTSSFGFQSYYTTEAAPLALHGQISQISGNVLTLLQADGATAASATASATNANVYLDNQPYINYVAGYQDTGFAPNGTDLRPITPSNETIVFPSGTYAASGIIGLDAGAGWSIVGQGQSATTLLAPKGAFPVGIQFGGQYTGGTVSDLTLTSNWGLSGFMFQIAGWTYIWAGFNSSGVMKGNDPGGNYITQISLAASPYPFGVLASSGHDNATIQRVTVNDVGQQAVAANFATNVNASNITVNDHSVRQNLESWLLQWGNTTGGSCTNCTINAVGLALGFESFQATGHQFISPVSVNALFSENTSNTWLIQNASITIQANSGSPLVDIHNPVININNNEGGFSVAAGGTISGSVINEQGYIDVSNDTLQGIAVNVDNPNVTITGGSYTAPNYSAPGLSPGPFGINSTGPSTSVSSFTSCGTVNTGGSNIAVSNGSVSTSKTNIIACSGSCTQSGNTTPQPSPCP